MKKGFFIFTVSFALVCIIFQIAAASNTSNTEGSANAVNREVKLYCSIEVPSAAIMADTMAKDVDFFSIGTNDLIQYSLAVDRVNRQVAHLYQPLNPAIIRIIKHVADIGKNSGVEVCMCGEMAGDPTNIPILLGLGVNKLRYLSMVLSHI